MQEFSRHPAADDAAYRLARCYEIEGRWAEALNTLQKARALPDGDMRYPASGRLLYVLDVRMTYEQLKELPVSALDPALPPMVSYSLAVKQIRRDDYRQAAGALEEIVRKYKEAGRLSNRVSAKTNACPTNRPTTLVGTPTTFVNATPSNCIATNETSPPDQHWVSVATYNAYYMRDRFTNYVTYYHLIPGNLPPLPRVTTDVLC